MKIEPSEYEILVVDDILSNVMLIKAILGREKYNIITATNGFDAIEIIKKKCPDLILLDVMMPQINGFEVCKAVREQLELTDVPIIMLTALNSNEDIVYGFSVGANDFVSKPFNNDVLLMRIRFQLMVVASHRMIVSQSKKLEEIIASRDQMYSVIAHDLRSPIATAKMIMNYVAGKIHNYDVDDDIIDMISNVNIIIEDSFSLFDNLLKWTKSQSGKLNYIPQEVEVTELVEGSIEILITVALQKGIKLIFIPPEERITVTVDIDMMKTVFRNIISNAIKFSYENSEITIKVTDFPDRVFFQIIDNGVGMDQQNIDKIVSGSIDSTKAGTANESGSGLGLRIARDFIMRNSGELSVISTPGKGSTFSFYIPK